MNMAHIDLGSRYLETSIKKRVLHVRINRPERRNAITQEMYRGLKRALIMADGNPELDVLCITGTGDVFAVGGDMSGLSEGDETLNHELDPTDHFPFRHLEQCRKVVLAAVNGICYAGGLNLVLFSDVSIASDKAKFRAPELLRGVPDPWISSRLVYFVGLAAAKYLLFTGAVIDAQEAASMGLIGKVVPHSEFEDVVQGALDEICLTAPKARAIVKDDMNRRLPAPDVNMFRRAILSDEMVEGFQAFVEKRDPEWPRKG